MYLLLDRRWILRPIKIIQVCFTCQIHKQEYENIV